MYAHLSLVGQVSPQLFYSKGNISSSCVPYLDFVGLYGYQSQTQKITRRRFGVASRSSLSRGIGVLSANTLTAVYPVCDAQLIATVSASFSDSNSELQAPFSGISRRINYKFTMSAYSPVAKDTIVDHDAKLPPASNPGWSEFAKNVSGEWDGHGADFTDKGMPIELPESVVPEAYREWEVRVFDWQTQCPTLAQPEPNFSLTYKLIRLLPTVGCEADAATRHSVEERHISSAKAFAYRSNGCYVALWSIGKNLLELEHCLVDSRDKESRVRIIQVLKVDDNNSPSMELQKIKVFKETWYGPYRNGDQLGGCSIRDSAFACTSSLESSQVNGVWQGLNATTGFFHPNENIAREMVDENEPRKSIRDGSESNLVLLPKQLWCSLDHKADNNEDKAWCCQVGWLLDEKLAVTSKCLFSWNPVFSFKEITMAYENAVSMHKI